MCIECAPALPVKNAIRKDAYEKIGVCVIERLYSALHEDVMREKTKGRFEKRTRDRDRFSNAVTTIIIHATAKGKHCICRRQCDASG